MLCASQLILVVHAFMLKRSLAGLPSIAALAFCGARVSISMPGLALLNTLRQDVPGEISAASNTTFHLSAAAGFFGVFLYPLLFILGLRLTSPTSACICEASTPIFSLAIETVVNRAAIRSGRTKKHGLRTSQLRRCVGVVLAVLGSVIVTLTTSSDAPDTHPHQHVGGSLLVLGSALSYAIFLNVQKVVMHRGATASSVTAWGNAFGGSLLLLYAWWQGAISPRLADFPSHFWQGVLYAGIATSVVGYSLEAHANSCSSSSLVAVYNAAQPVVVSAASFLTLRHRATIPELVAATVVVAGILLLHDSEPGKQQKRRHVV